MNQAEKKESKKKISKTAPPQEKKDESKTIQPTETLKTDQMVQLQKELDELKK
jgi:hypothetical protein